MASISDLLQTLSKAEEVPTEALTALVERFDEAAPPLRDLLDKAARGRPLSDDDATVFFYGLHVLAAARDSRSFPALLRFLRRPNEEIDDLLGDAVFESLRRIIAGLFDGDADALFAAATDARLDDVLRDAFIAAATFLTWDGRIPRERMHAFLSAFEDRPPPDGDMAWYSWIQAITCLGLRDLMPRVERVFAADRLPADFVEWRHIDQNLRDAERAPSDPERFDAIGLGYADDVTATLGWARRANGDDPPEEPFVNPYRDVGRNDPCPCGSGKKFKKCCLNKSLSGDASGGLVTDS